VAFALALLAVLVVVASAPLLVDTTVVRDRATRQATATLGHPVHLDGEVRLTLLPFPTLVFEDVRVENPRWGTRPQLLTVRRVALEPSLGGLLRGEFVVAGLALEGVEAWLLRDEAGRFNWQRESDSDGPGRLDEVVAREVVLHYGDGAREATLAVARIRGAMEGDGRFDARLEGQLADPGSLLPAPVLDALGARDGALALETRLVVGPGPELALSEMTLGTGAPVASADLRLDWGAAPPRVEAGLRLGTLRLPGACPEVGGAGEGMSVDALAADLEAAGWAAELAIDVSSLHLGELALPDLQVAAGAGGGELLVQAASGTDQARLELRRREAGVVRVGVTLKAGHEVASDLLRCFGLPSRTAERVATASLELEGEGEGWRAVLDGAHGRFRATWPADGKVKPWDVVGVEGEVAAGRLEGGVLALARPSGPPVEVALTGGALQELAGGEWPFEARFTLPGRAVETRATLKQTADGPLMKGSFRVAPTGPDAAGLALEGGGRWQVSGRAVEFSDMDVRVEGNALSGALAFDLAAQPLAVRGDLRLGTTTLDWLASLAPGGVAGATGLPPFTIEGLGVRVGQLEGLPFTLSDVRARLTTRDDELRFDPLGLDMLSSRWKGAIALNVAARPPTATYSLAAESVDLSTLGEGAEALLEVRAAEQVELSGRWTGADFAAVASSLEVDVSGRRLVLAGLPDALGDLALEQVTARYRPASGLAASGLATLKGESFELDLAASPHDERAGWRVKGAARGALGAVRAAGDLKDGAVGEMQLDAEGPDLARLLALLGAPQEGAGGAWRGRARLLREGEVLVVSPLEAGADGFGNVSGEARLTGGKRPRLTADLSSERLDLSIFAPDLAPPAPVEGRRIPNSPLPVPPELPVDADVSLRVGEVLGLPERMRDVRAQIRGREGLVVAEDVRATFDSGSKVVGRVESAAGAPARRWKLELEGAGVDMGVFYPHGEPGRRFGWPADAMLSLEGSGDDVHALLANARGELHVSGARTTLGSEDFSVWDVNVLTMMLPRLGEGRPARMNCASIEAEIGDGRLTTEALVIDAENVTIAGSGSLDLRSEAVDPMLVPQPKQRSLMRGSTPVHVTGTLSEPQISVATGSVVASSGLLLLGAVNPYLLLGAMVPASSGEAEDVCDRAVELAEKAPKEVEETAASLQKAHSGGVTRVLTAPFRAIGRGLGAGGADGADGAGPPPPVPSPRDD
jgi:hypothetical protein